MDTKVAVEARLGEDLFTFLLFGEGASLLADFASDGGEIFVAMVAA